jgi:spermidine synthase
MELLRLIQRGKSVRLQAPEGTFSYYHPDKLFTGLGWDSQTASLLLVKRPVRSILILGLGAGTVARQCRAIFPQSSIVGVDNNEKIVCLAYRHFDLRSTNMEVVISSGQHYLKNTRRKFDAIIDDMWPLKPFSPKPALTESGWPTLIKFHLNPDGVYALNLYSRGESSFEVQSAIQRLSTHFSMLCEVQPGPGETTVIAAGFNLRRPAAARAALRGQPKSIAAALRHIRFRTVLN